MENRDLSNSGAFVTPDGLIWSCHGGEHGYSATQIVEKIGMEAAQGSLIIWPSGMWAQEGAQGSITDAQRESITTLAGFPPSGIKTAADNILATFSK